MRLGRVIKRFLVGWGAGRGQGPIYMGGQGKPNQLTFKQRPAGSGAARQSSIWSQSSFLGTRPMQTHRALRSEGSPAWSDVPLSLSSHACILNRGLCFHFV